MLPSFHAFKLGKENFYLVQNHFPFLAFTYSISTLGCSFHGIPSIRIFVLFELELGSCLLIGIHAVDSRTRANISTRIASRLENRRREPRKKLSSSSHFLQFLFFSPAGRVVSRVRGWSMLLLLFTSDKIKSGFSFYGGTRV